MRRLAVALAGLLATLAVVVIGTGTAWAQDEESPESIRGFLRNEGAPVEGVTITVSDDDGEVGTVETAADGSWQIPVPGPGEYEVVLDADTLPSDVPGVVTDTVTTTVNALQDKAVLFRIGEPGSDTGGEGDTTTVPAEGSADTAQPSQIWQLVASGVRFGLILALAALGLSLIFGTIGLTNFAHGELVTFGAIVAWFLNDAGLPVIAAGALAVALSGGFGWAQDVGFWRPLRRRGTGLIAMMIVSIGVATAPALSLPVLLRRASGAPTTSSSSRRAIDFGPFGYAPRDLWIMGISLAALALVTTALLRTRIGKATRAVSDNPALASASGIDVDRVITVGLDRRCSAGRAGRRAARADPTGRLPHGLPDPAARVRGSGPRRARHGVRAPWSAPSSSGSSSRSRPYVIPSELKYAGALGVLIVILLVRPQGILGRRERIG